MQSKKWAIWCAFVGIIGGAFIMVAPLGLLAAGIGANGQMFDNIFILLLCTCVVVFGVALKSKLYYKGDDRVSTFVANTFLLAGILGCAPILIVILSKVLFLDRAVLQFFDLVEEEVDIFLILFPPIVVVGVLSIISGLGYASSLKNFKE